MNYKNIIKKQSFIITVSIVVMGIILVGTSYALFTNQNNSNTQVVSSGTLVVNYAGTTITTIGGTDNGGNLLEIEPIDEATVNTLSPFTIVVNNTGTLAMRYNVVIYTDETNTLPHSYYAFKYKDNGSYTQKATLTTLPKVDPSQTNMNEIVYKLTSVPFVVEPGSSATHEVYVWIDEDLADENISNKIASIKIAVVGEATDAAPVYPTAIEYLTNLASTNNTIIDDETTDHNLRYIGANPNNYASFNNESWRVIGVMNNMQTSTNQTQNLVKIIRSEKLGNYSWDTSTSSVNSGYGVNQWGTSASYTGADLMRELNTDYLGNVTVGTDSYWYNGQNDAKTANKPTTTLSSDTQAMIETVVWKTGTPNNNGGTYIDWTSTTLTPTFVYSHERANASGKICTSGTYCTDTIGRTTSWTGKIGLMYPSDYLFATSGGSTTNRQTCMGLGIQSGWSNSSYTDCKNNDWLLDTENYQWTLSPYLDSTSGRYSFVVTNSGLAGGTYTNGPYIVRPALYLKSNVTITGGSGTQADPYILE